MSGNDTRLGTTYSSSTAAAAADGLLPARWATTGRQAHQGEAPQERHNRNSGTFHKVYGTIKKKKRGGGKTHPQAHDHHAAMAAFWACRWPPLSPVPVAPCAGVGPLVSFILIILWMDWTHLADGIF